MKRSLLLDFALVVALILVHAGLASACEPVAIVAQPFFATAFVQPAVFFQQPPVAFFSAPPQVLFLKESRRPLRVDRTIRQRTVTRTFIR